MFANTFQYWIESRVADIGSVDRARPHRRRQRNATFRQPFSQPIGNFAVRCTLLKESEPLVVHVFGPRCNLDTDIALDPLRLGVAEDGLLNVAVFNKAVALGSTNSIPCIFVIISCLKLAKSECNRQESVAVSI